MDRSQRRLTVVVGLAAERLEERLAGAVIERPLAPPRCWVPAVGVPGRARWARRVRRATFVVDRRRLSQERMTTRRRPARGWGRLLVGGMEVVEEEEDVAVVPMVRRLVTLSLWLPRRLRATLRAWRLVGEAPLDHRRSASSWVLRARATSGLVSFLPCVLLHASRPRADLVFMAPR